MGLFSNLALVATLISKSTAMQTSDCGDLHWHHIMFSTARSHSQPVVHEKLPNHKGKFAQRQEAAFENLPLAATLALWICTSTSFRVICIAVPCVTNTLARGAVLWPQEGAMQEVHMECLGLAKGYRCLSSWWGKKSQVSMSRYKPMYYSVFCLLHPLLGKFWLVGCFLNES